MTPEEHYKEAENYLEIISAGNEMHSDDFTATCKAAELHFRAAEVGLQIASLAHKKSTRHVGYTPPL